MFHVGRFDPAAEQKAAAIAARKAKRPKAVGNDASTRSRKRSAITPDGEPKIEVQKHQKRQAKADQKVHSHDDDDDDDSSSVPSSSDSDGSSSVPSSSDDEGDEKSRPTTLKVIAPSQPIAGDARKHKRQQHGGFEDEAIDDFDADIDIIESAQPISSPHGTNTTSSASTRKINDPVAARALRLSRLPIAEVASAKHWGLPPFLIRNLEADSYTNFFPIQCMVIPDVIESERNSHLRGARDVCCHAPTGSGKTLAFALPLLTALYNENPAKSVDGRACPRGLRRLRALVVLPGRDLAKQVYDVFVRYSKGSHIKVGLAVGGGKKKADLVNERRSLVVETYNEAFNEIRDEDGSFIRRKAEGLFESAAARTRHEFDPTQINTALEAFDGTIRKDSGPQIFPQFGGQSAVDILVATPGRLMDHLDSTPGFTLQHLRFLVIDEADRLINQNNQNWVGRVLEASNSSNRFDNQMSLSQYVKSPLQVAPDGITFVIDPITHRLAGSGLTNVTFGDKEKSDDGLVSGFFGRPVPLRKMLFSATLTQDPQKLARLGLVNPKHFDANVLKQLARIEEAEGTDNVVESMKTGRYSVPGGLREKMVECTAEQKPLVLLALLLEEERSHVAIKPNKGDPESVNLCVVFTSSIDSTHRLARLLQLLWVAGGFGKSSAIAEFSSSINAKQRAAILRRCRNGGAENGVSVLVCSDGMSRGMDLPSVSAVINYDVPAYSKTYVHRCGRTARAGREGKAISVLKGGQVAKFHKMRNLIDGGSVEKMGIKKDLVKGVIPTYKACVRALQKVITAEDNEELLHTDPLDGKEWIPK